jgi:hypothetical protein
MTPIAKAFGTDIGIETTSIGVQVHGGYGYIEETGAAQDYRDARIAAIYEGTNGIQAVDLVTRKLAIRDGGAVRELIDEARSTATRLAEAGSTDLADGLSSALDVFAQATDWMLQAGDRPGDLLAGAAPYLRMGGLAVGGWLLGRSVLALPALSDQGFARRKEATARFHLTQLLPQVHGLMPAVSGGASVLAGAVI